MFNIFKKKENKIEKIYSPFKGNLVNLEDFQMQFLPKR